MELLERLQVDSVKQSTMFRHNLIHTDLSTDNEFSATPLNDTLSHSNR